MLRRQCYWRMISFLENCSYKFVVIPVLGTISKTLATFAVKIISRFLRWLVILKNWNICFPSSIPWFYNFELILLRDFTIWTIFRVIIEKLSYNIASKLTAKSFSNESCIAGFSRSPFKNLATNLLWLLSHDTQWFLSPGYKSLKLSSNG